MSRNAETFKNGAKKSPARCTTLCNAFIPKTPDQSPLIAPSCENVGASHRSTSEPSPSGSCDGGRWYTLNSPKKLGAVRISLSCSMTGGGVASRTGSGGAGGGGGGRRLVGMSRRLLGRKSLRAFGIRLTRCGRRGGSCDQIIVSVARYALTGCLPRPVRRQVGMTKLPLLRVIAPAPPPEQVALSPRECATCSLPVRPAQACVSVPPLAESVLAVCSAHCGSSTRVSRGNSRRRDNDTCPCCRFW